MTVTVSCPSCNTSFPVDPAKVPPEGVRAQCSVCPEIFEVERPSEAAPAASPAPDSTLDAIEPADPLEGATTDLPPLEGAGDAVAAAGTSEGETAPAATEDAAKTTVEGEGPGPIRFGRRSPADKAKSLARSLVSDLIAYNPEKHKEALAGGNLQEVFGEEIEKSLKEYQEQVEPDVIAEGSFFNDALNSILAEGQSIFSLDN
jgi:predicted Zn finger-like uncharacterized protein